MNDAVDWASDDAAYAEVMRRAAVLFTEKNALYGGSWRLQTVAGMLERLQAKLSRAQTLLHHPHLAERARGERLQDTLLDLVNESALALAQTLIFAQLAKRSASDGTDTAAALTRELEYLEAAIRDGSLGLYEAHCALEHYLQTHQGAESAYVAASYDEVREKP